jgi:microcystin-dependent protein
MAFTQLTASVANVAALDDLPTASSATIKATFDKAGTDIKTFINSTLIGELEAVGAAAKLGCTGAHATIQAFITAVEAAGSGTTPGAGVVTNGMLAVANKTGLLADLLTTAKTDLVAAINELKAATLVDRTATGIIRMWSGTIATIPSGNVLCDGTQGTPDLRNRFIMGAADQAGMNATGGSNTTTLTTIQLPAHTHTGTTSSDGSHSHTVGGSGGTGGSSPLMTASGSGTTVNTSSAGEHNHTFTTASSGTGAAYDSRNAFYALAYIMRVAD